MNKEKFRLSNISALLIAVMVIGAGLVYFAQNSSVSEASFGFEKNIDVRRGADAESVAGCMQSCEDMLAGWLEMNPNSPNYTRQKDKIEAKAEQCLGMNELAGLPFSEEQILASCGLEPEPVPGPACVEVTPEQIHSGACGDIPFTGELIDLPQCCALEGGPSGDRLCGTEAEWVVGVTAVPTCYIPGS